MSESSHPHARWRLWPLLFGLAASALVYYLLSGPVEAHRLSEAGRWVGAIGALMAAWWMTEAIPIEATGLLPLALFPLVGARKIDDAAGPYADKIIFLFLGGMLLGQAMECWGLHRRFALSTVSLFGSRPSRLVGAFLFSTAFVSMWVSNTAATIMMLPIGASVAQWVTDHLTDSSPASARCRERLGPGIVLAIAFGASIGGVGTLIGTPPIGQYAAFMGKLGHPVSFVSWLKMGLPTLAIVLPATWFVLSRVTLRIGMKSVPGVHEEIKAELSAMGRMSQGEWATLIIFTGAAVLWVVSRLLSVDDAVIAIGAAVLLFVVPVSGREHEPRRPVLTWREAERIPWGILLLFGGGLSLAESIKATGVDQFIATGADSLTGLSLLPLMWTIALVTIILTEFTNNTALVAAGLPVVEAIAVRLNVPPAALLCTMTLTASLGFMLPAGTAPNALVFASGHVTMRQMMKCGFWLDVTCAFLVPLMVTAAMKLDCLPGL